MKHKLLLLLFIPCILFSQGKLKSAKNSLSNSSSSNSSSSNSSSSSSSDNDGGGFFDDLFLELAYHVTLGVGFGEARYTEMNQYPYYNDGGEYTRNFEDGNNKRSSLRFGANYLINRVKGLEINSVFKPIPILGIEVSHVNFSEQTLLSSESLNVTSINANYYRFREKYFSLWWGAGVTYVGNEVDTWGGLYNIGADIYPFKPISLHFSWKQSFINDGEVDVFKSQIKYHIKKTALYTGYHNYKLGSETVSGVVFGLEYTF